MAARLSRGSQSIHPGPSCGLRTSPVVEIRYLRANRRRRADMGEQIAHCAYIISVFEQVGCRWRNPSPPPTLFHRSVPCKSKCSPMPMRSPNGVENVSGAKSRFGSWHLFLSDVNHRGLARRGPKRPRRGTDEVLEEPFVRGGRRCTGLFQIPPHPHPFSPKAGRGASYSALRSAKAARRGSPNRHFFTCVPIPRASNPHFSPIEETGPFLGT
jgi:hypothetical protein